MPDDNLDFNFDDSIGHASDNFHTAENEEAEEFPSTLYGTNWDIYLAELSLKNQETNMAELLKFLS
jgi:hypothetical protein